MGGEMTHSTIREPHGPEGNRGAKLSFESEPEGSSLRVEDRVIVRLRRSRLEVLWFDKLTTPRKIEGRRIEG